MKTYLTYGFAMALGGILLTVALYLLGYHSEAAKFATGEWISRLGMLAIAITCIVLGTKARRAELPVAAQFGYGSALGTGVMITLFAALFGLVTNYLYMQVINPGFADFLIQTKIAEVEAHGASSTQVEQMEKGMRMFMQPVFMGAFVFLFSMFWGTVISLITAAFLKRSANELPPVVA